MVFVTCTVPPHGHSSLDTLEPQIQAIARKSASSPELAPMHPKLAKLVLGEDLDDAAFGFCLERLVPESRRLNEEPVDLSALSSSVSRTWIRTTQDTIVSPQKQLRFAANVGNCPVVDIDAGHMCMVSCPQRLAELILELTGMS